MGYTPRYRFRFLDRQDSANLTRAILQENAETLEAGLTKVHARANDLALLLPAGQAVIGLDIDGRPYFNPAGTVSNPVPVGLDTDGRPYFVPLNPEGL